MSVAQASALGLKPKPENSRFFTISRFVFFLTRQQRIIRHRRHSGFF
jgi:hypothetical protein